MTLRVLPGFDQVHLRVVDGGLCMLYADQSLPIDRSELRGSTKDIQRQLERIALMLVHIVDTNHRIMPAEYRGQRAQVTIDVGPIRDHNDLRERIHRSQWTDGGI